MMHLHAPGIHQRLVLAVPVRQVWARGHNGCLHGTMTPCLDARHRQHTTNTHQYGLTTSIPNQACFLLQM